ncbi:MAG: methylenetetrahydrofolate reductase [Puniceicoccales bacterium]|jgi:methylenetetrahydrofolate reductase (NADPH)|nr:methylenetetrahydrofolate reductase [Puniceicoccales bacterium]
MKASRLNEHVSIAELLRAACPAVSIEFFPPKTEEGARQIFRTAQALRPRGVAFASITYGAGGSTRERTFDYGELLQNLFGFRVLPHLTCVGHSRDDLARILDSFLGAGFPGVMALRGDPPKGERDFKPAPNGFSHASELVALARERQRACGVADFSVSVAGYPEKHPDAPDVGTDARHMAAKVAAGADFVTTQMFFDNEHYFSFVRRCRAMGVNVPILPGILPVLSLEHARKFATFGTSLPKELEERLSRHVGNPEAAQAEGVEWAFRQVRGLLDAGAPGFHLYILNRSESAIALLDRLVG